MERVTDELRKWKGNIQTYLSPEVVLQLRCELNGIADRIDAEYQKAEDEWKAKHGQMWLNGYAECRAELMEGNEAIAASLEEAGWVKLPVDADGVPIRIGDVMECGDGTVFTVESISLYTFGWRCDGDGIDENGYECTTHPLPCSCRHHEPTIQDVLMEFAYKILDPDQTDAIPHRIKRYAEEYADKMHATIEWSEGPEWQETASQK